MTRRQRPAGEIGQRVKLVAPSPLVTLRSPFGVVVGLDDLLLGYVIVRLDEPAIYHGWYAGIQTDEDLPEIREDIDNLEPAP